MEDPLKRNLCCICESSEINPFEQIKAFPAYMGVTERDSAEDLFFDQNWGICKKCGLLQLLDLIPIEILYSENHSTEAVGETWKSHHEEFGKFISLSSAVKVLEIGGAHGELARRLIDINKNFDYTTIEPSPGNFPNECLVVVGYIEDNLSLIDNVDSVIHSHVLEHIYSPMKFLSEVAKRMKHNSKMYISYPNIEQLVKMGGTNSLNFEHTYFLTPKQLRVVCSNLGLELTREVEFRKHSFFWELTKKQKPKEQMEIPNIGATSESFKELWPSLSRFVSDCNKVLEQKSMPTYIFGAHVFSQGLVSLGLKVQLIDGVLDNAKDKQGKRLYGTNLQVLNPDYIRDIPAVRVILRTTQYQEEIKNQLQLLNPLIEIVE